MALADLHILDFDSGYGGTTKRPDQDYTSKDTRVGKIDYRLAKVFSPQRLVIEVKSPSNKPRISKHLKRTLHGIVLLSIICVLLASFVIAAQLSRPSVPTLTAAVSAAFVGAIVGLAASRLSVGIRRFEET